MSRLVRFQFRPLPAMRVVGKSISQLLNMQENPIPAFWSACFADGTFKILESLSGHSIDDAYVGLMCDYNSQDGKFTYFCGMLMDQDCPVPEGFSFKDFPASMAAVGWVQGPEKENYGTAHELTQRELEQHGFRADESAAWCLELYNCPRFTQPQPNGEVILDYYIPCLPGRSGAAK